jgi:hypothetical protein
MRRTFDPVEVNAILNDPEVFKWIKLPGLEKIDATDLIFELRNYFLITNGGVIAFIYQEPGVYEAHNNFLKPFRGRNAFKESIEAVRWMFTHTDCMILHTKVPEFNKGAEIMARAVGGTCDFERKGTWPTDNGPVDVSYWSLKYEDWLKKTPSLMNAGREFHKHLDAERDRMGAPDDSHPDEDCHDLYVGACVETIKGGQPEKAVILYNRFARFSGYEPISLFSKEPLIVDIASSLLLVEDQSFRILKCR